STLLLGGFFLRACSFLGCGWDNVTSWNNFFGLTLAFWQNQGRLSSRILKLRRQHAGILFCIPKAVCQTIAPNKNKRTAQRGQPSGKQMKQIFLWTTALALAVTVTSPIETRALTNGVILITTRNDQDISYGGGEVFDQKGPGNTAPGDTAMVEILGD